MRRVLAASVLVPALLVPLALAAPCDPCDRSLHGPAPCLTATYTDPQPLTIERTHVYRDGVLVTTLPCAWHETGDGYQVYVCPPYAGVGWPLARSPLPMIQGTTNEWRLTAYRTHLAGDPPNCSTGAFPCAVWGESGPSNIATSCGPCTWSVGLESYASATARCPCVMP